MASYAHSIVINIGSTNILKLVGIQYTESLIYPTDATVTGQISQIGGGVVGGSLTFTYLNGTSGSATEYRTVMDATTAALFSPDLSYEMDLTVTDTSGDTLLLHVGVSAVYA